MNIFAGTELPQWMQSVRKENAILGESLGTVLAGGLLGMQQDPNTIDPNTGTTKTDPKTGEPMGWLSTRKGFQQGLAEARMNQADPNWRVKEKALEGQAVANWARAATMWQQYDTTSKDMAAWTTHDLPAISKYQQELRDDPNAVPPVVESSKGMQALNQIERAQMAAQAMKVKQDSTKLAIENDKRQFEFRNAYTADPELQSNIEGLGRAAWNYDAQGRATSPSTTALQIYNSWAKEHGKDPFGYKPTAVDAAKARGEEQRKTQAAKAQSPRETTAIKNIQQMRDWEQQAKDAESSGDTELAKDLRKNVAMLQEQMKGWGVSITGYDDQGRPIISMGKGAQPTVGIQTMAQGKLLQYENASQLIDYLEKNLTAQHVGVAGAAGELIFDKSMEQIIPGSENKERVRVRATLQGLRETLMREMSDDRTGRFSVADREEVGKALPSSGIFESEADAKDRLQRVREILANRTKVYSRSMGIQPPAWSLNETDKDEIVKRYQDGLKSTLDPKSDEFKKRYLTKEEAIDALTRKP